MEKYITINSKEKIIRKSNELTQSNLSNFNKEFETNNCNIDIETDKNSFFRKLGRDFFMTDAVDLAKQLLNKLIVRKVDDETLIFRIVETEAYMGPEDKACHAYNNKKTDRTKYFWTIGGSVYVFNIYMPTHYCFNIVANEEELPQAVLIRAVEPYDSKTLLAVKKAKNKLKSNDNPSLFNGPAKAGVAMRIDKSFNGIDLCNSDEIFLTENEKIINYEIETSKRINIDYAQEYINKEWRFFVKNNEYVSKAPKSFNKKKIYTNYKK